MRSISEMVLLMLPAFCALLLLAFFAVPMRFGGVMLCPNVGMLVTVVVVPLLPAAWPRLVAFGFGVIQDLVFATPVGVHALLLVVLVGLCAPLSARGYQPFQLRFAAAAKLLFGMHLALWAVLHVVERGAPGILLMVQSAVVSLLWYPLFYLIFSRLEKMA